MEAAADRLQSLLEKARADLEVNPLQLLARIGKLQDGLGELQAECDEVLAARQDLVEVARLKILADRRALCNMQARAGLPVRFDNEDSAYQGLYQVLQACEQHADFKEAADWRIPLPGLTRSVE
eukprot:SM000034S12774  [mRNA]  locus=s34:598211:599360:- [translate_table: standard]